MKQLAVDLLNTSGGGLPECATETARVLKTFVGWVHILVNGKSALQNSWRCLVFLLPICFSKLANSNKWQRKKCQTIGDALRRAKCLL